MAGIGGIAEALTARKWSAADADELIGARVRTCVGHAADESVRAAAASGGAVSALLISALETGSADACLVARTVVTGGRVRLAYSLATTRDEVLAAQGSTYVLGDFVREAVPLIEAHPGRVAVVCLPCEATALTRRPELADRVALVIGLFCGHASRPELVDDLTARLSEQAGSPLTAFRFRSGHWRGTLTARFESGEAIERPFSAFGTPQNLYYGCARKCLSCGDHFGYDADVSAGDLWSSKYKSDPVKHTALIAKTGRGAAAIAAAVSGGHLEAVDVDVADVLDGQRRIAPFHHNVTARARAAKRIGIAVPDRGQAVAWHERLAARMVVSAAATDTAEGLRRVLARPGWYHKSRLYVLKGLESLSGVAPVPRARRYAIIAPTVGGNRGAEAMFETTVGRIRDRDAGATFAFYSYMPKTDARLLSDPGITVHSATPAHLVLALFPASLLLGLLRAVGLRRLGTHLVPRSVADLAGCAALLDLAGVSFIDGREKYLPFNLLTLWPAMLLGVPVIKLSQAMGPFEHLATRLASRTLWRCRMVVPRGAGTLAHLRGASFPDALTFPAADVAFGFEERDALSDEGAEEVRGLVGRAATLRASGTRVLGLCPSSVIASKAAKQGWDYVGFLADIVEGLLADGVGVLLFPNATRAAVPDKLRNNDLPVIASVVARVSAKSGSDRLLAVTGDVSAVEIRRLVSGCDAVAVSRFHAMVGALSAEVPVVVLGWSHKYAEVMDSFGLDAWVFDYADRDAAAFLARCRKLLEERDALRARIAERLPAVKADSVAQFDEVMRRLR